MVSDSLLFAIGKDAGPPLPVGPAGPVDPGAVTRPQMQLPADGQELRRPALELQRAGRVAAARTEVDSIAEAAGVTPAGGDPIATLSLVGIT
ncbi:hypothetical protein [Actinoplanes philippinensis]|uniref:hypothetical protein n=1 Tax=Actinoplanes philippinensis TaxID=35752 RepID=UPI0033F26B3B